VTSHAEALARTTLLLNREQFDGQASEPAIADGLLATTVRLHANQANLVTRAGQAALITAFALIARMGIGVELAIADVEVLDLVAPLRRPTLGDALVDLGSDLVPGTTVRTGRGEVDLTIAVGDTPCRDEPALRVYADELSCAIVDGSQPASRIAADWPLGAFAGATAVAPIVLEAALPRIEAATGLQRTTKPRPSPGPPVALDWRELFPGLPTSASRAGRLDLVSGGAITNAVLFVLLRLPGLSATARVIEAQDADLSNVNRYMLLRTSHQGIAKTRQLEAASSKAIHISGVRELFTKETRRDLAPLAERVLVGVDDVEARWWVQQEWPQWLCVAATQATIAETTTHSPGGPCAACLHADPLPAGEIIPTISFVSFWAGLLQACELLSDLEREQPSRRVMLWPFALGGPARSHVTALRASNRCPIACRASREIPSSR
jgi:hypothetical protein